MPPCREHVVIDEHQKRLFLQGHPLHRYLGNEDACSLEEYVDSFKAAGLVLDRVLGPWDSVISAFPNVEDDDGLVNIAAALLKRRFGARFGHSCVRRSWCEEGGRKTPAASLAGTVVHLLGDLEVALTQ